MIFPICLATFLLAPPPPADAPKVEIDFTAMRSGDWEGKRFNEIVPADRIKRIVRLRESGFARGNDVSGEQADYDALFVHLLDSTVPATGWSLGGNEGTLAELVILTKEGDILRVEVIGTPATPSSPTAILMHGKGRGARINVKGFKHPERKKLLRGPPGVGSPEPAGRGMCLFTGPFRDRFLRGPSSWSIEH